MRAAAVLLAGATVGMAGCETRSFDRGVPEATSVASADWAAYYAPEAVYFNASDGPVAVLRVPVQGAAVVGQVEPDRGGLIQNCSPARSGDAPAFCQIAVGSLNALGWVAMVDFRPHPPAR